MVITHETKLDFKDILLVPSRSELASRKEVNLVRTFKPKYGKSFSGVPLICSNMLTGSFPMLEVFSQNLMFVAIAKHFNPLWRKLNFRKNIDPLTYGFYTIGKKEEELEELKRFYNDLILQVGGEQAKSLKICLDIANGYSSDFPDFVSKVRDTFPSSVIVAGNVCTTEITQQLILSGADYVKEGIGSGGECETRLKTGIGYPQVSVALETSNIAHGLRGGIVLDGGITSPGDICKALCAGADLVMAGSIFSGTDEQEGDIITRYFETNEYMDKDLLYKKTIEKKYKVFYGMSSDFSQEQHFGGVKDYRTSEGKVEEVEYKGPVQNIINHILGGLRSCGTYIGADEIKDFSKRALGIKVNRQHNRF